VFYLRVMCAFQRYGKCTKTTKWLDKIDNQKKCDTEEGLLELEDMDLGLTMNDLGFRE